MYVVKTDYQLSQKYQERYVMLNVLLYVFVCPMPYVLSCYPYITIKINYIYKPVRRHHIRFFCNRVKYISVEFFLLPLRSFTSFIWENFYCLSHFILESLEVDFVG